MEAAHNAIRNPDDLVKEGQRLAQFMEWEGITPADLAAATDRNVSAISKYQLGQLVIPRDVMHVLYFNYGLNIEWLLFGTGHHKNEQAAAQLAESLKAMRKAVNLAEQALAQTSAKKQLKKV